VLLVKPEITLEPSVSPNEVQLPALPPEGVNWYSIDRVPPPQCEGVV